MSFIADAHREWHTANGQYNSNCPLDCGAMSPEAQAAEDEANYQAYQEWLLTPEGIEYAAEGDRAWEKLTGDYPHLDFDSNEEPPPF